MRILSEGAEAQILSTEVLGIRAVVKRRIRKGYRSRQLDEAIRASRTRTEAKTLALASTNGIDAPVLLLVDGFDLYMSRIDGIRPQELTKAQAGRAGAILARLHALDIAHGDFTPANMLVRDGRLYIIDFGLAEITRSIEERALDLLLMKRSLGQKEAETFLAGYRDASATAASDILSRLAQIEKRGRYHVRTLA